MPKVEGEEMVRVHIWLYKRDVDRLHAIYDRNIGYSRGIRAIIRRWLDHIEAKGRASAKSIAVDPADVDLSSLDQKQ